MNVSNNWGLDYCKANRVKKMVKSAILYKSGSYVDLEVEPRAWSLLVSTYQLSRSF